MAQVLTLLVLVQVIYLKFFVWHDDTLYGGLLLGAIAAGAFHLIAKAAPSPYHLTNNPNKNKKRPLV